MSHISFSGYTVFYEMDKICSVEYFDTVFLVLYVLLASFTISENTVMNVLTDNFSLTLHNFIRINA